jgi:hypothetical protein
MRRQAHSSSIAVAGAAGAGLILAHTLAYVIAVPSSTARQQVLAHTGHSYWFVLPKAAIVLALASMVAGVARAMRGAYAANGGAVPLAALAGGMALLQVAAFLGMEVAERLFAGAEVADLLSGHLLLVGLAVQILSALSGALLLHWLDRAVGRVVLALRGPPLAARRSLLHLLPPQEVVAPRSLMLAGAAGVRGPPIS